jgi:hypothetical protein
MLLRSVCRKTGNLDSLSYWIHFPIVYQELT